MWFCWFFMIIVIYPLMNEMQYSKMHMINNLSLSSHRLIF